MEAQGELWLSGWQLPHTTTKGRVRVTNPPGKRHRSAFGVTVPNPLQHARATYGAPKSESTQTAVACPAQRRAARLAAAGCPGAAPSQRRPLRRSGSRERAATQAATLRGSPRRAVGQGDTHPPKQAAGGEVGGRERSGRRCRCYRCWPPASSPLFGFDRPRHS